jgi:hypothetical protein
MIVELDDVADRERDFAVADGLRQTLCRSAITYLIIGSARRESIDDPEATRQSVRRLLDLPFEVLCMDHGAPIVVDPHRELRKLLGKDEPRDSQAAGQHAI